MNQIVIEHQTTGGPGSGGPSSAIVSFRHSDGRTLGDDEESKGISLVFDFDRTSPYDLRYEGAGGLIWPIHERLDQQTWWIPLDDRSSEIRRLLWTSPLSGSRLRDSPVVQKARPKPGESVLKSYCSSISRLENDLREERVLWCRIDLATAAADIPQSELPDVAETLGIDVSLLKALTPHNVDALHRNLVERWRMRTLCSAAKLDTSLFLPWHQLHQTTAQQVIKLMVTVFRKGSGLEERSHEQLWSDVLSFASGQLLLQGDKHGRFNAAPNSFGFACFAELFDLGLHKDGCLDNETYVHACNLRAMFIAALDPFLETFIKGDAAPRKVNSYKAEHLEGRELPWPSGRRDALKSEFISRFGIGEDATMHWVDGLPAPVVGKLRELRTLWGEKLEGGLGDEEWLIQARRNPCRKP